MGLGVLLIVVALPFLFYAIHMFDRVVRTLTAS